MRVLVWRWKTHVQSEVICVCFDLLVSRAIEGMLKKYRDLVYHTRIQGTRFQAMFLLYLRSFHI